MSHQGEENFAAIQAEFDRLLPSGLRDILGNEVIIGRDVCHHICYKQEQGDARGPRIVWREDRAQRIPWIHEALTRPRYIRKSGESWAYLVEIPEDKANSLVPELFMVIVTARGVTPGTPGKVYLTTGYAIDYNK